MNVDIFSDVVCPWCAVGKRRFDKALKEFPHADEVSMQFRSFELDPSSPAVIDGDSTTHLAEKYGMSREEAVAAHVRMTQVAAQEGLDFHFDQAKRGNSFDAHRLLHFAHEVGVQEALKERLFAAYFTEGEAIGDRATLIRLGEQVGLDPIKTAEVLDSGRYANEVRADEREAGELGITGVPFFVIDGQFGISGAQSPDVILGVLNQAWSKQHPLVVTPSDGETSCEGDSCTI